MIAVLEFSSKEMKSEISRGMVLKEKNDSLNYKLCINNVNIEDNI